MVKMRLSLKLSIVGILCLVATFITVFISGIIAVIFFVLFIVFLIAAWVSTVPERGGIFAWLHRRKEEQEDYDAAQQHLRRIRAEGRAKRQGELDAEDRYRRRW